MKIHQCHKFIISVLILLTAGIVASREVLAVWVWSPETGKWENPKDKAKDEPTEQLQFAVSFYEKGDTKRALEEFDKLIKAYPNTRQAAEAQYFKGLSFEAADDLAKAAENYKILIDRYPYSDRLNEAIANEFEIAEQMMGGKKAKLLGMEIIPSIHLAAEIYEHIVKSAPYSDYGARAQFRLGDAYVAMGDLDLAVNAYQAVMDEYPNSELAIKAQYQIARTTYRSSQKEEYHVQAMDEAIREFERFKTANPRSDLAYEANDVISELRQKKAENLFEVASFYEQRGKLQSAKLYYNDLLSKFPDAPVATLAKQRLEDIKAAEMGLPKEESSRPWWQFYRGKKG